MTADLIISGRVATLAGDSGFGWQPGLAIAGDRIVAIAAEGDLEQLAGPRTRRWRLADDELAMPGITDAHLHLMNLVLGEDDVDLTGLPLDQALEAIGTRHRRMADAGDHDGWLRGHGWSADALGGWPTAEDLEQVAPGRPVALHAHDHHARWVSVSALRVAGISEQTEDPPGGLVRRAADGRPTGVLHETASALADASIPTMSVDELVAALTRVAARLAALGVTGCHDPGELTAETDITRGPVLYRALAEQGRLPLRVHASVRAPQLERAIELGLRSGERIGHYTMGWLKLFADGSLGSRSAALLAPYSDAHVRPPTGGPAGMYLTRGAELSELLRRAAAAGIAGQVHAIGDGAVREALDALADLPRQRLMRRIEHAQLVDPADQPRFGELGIAASVQPIHLRSDAAAAREAWGGRAEHAFPLRGLLDGGALIPFGTDAPVEPPDPWPNICVAVTRSDPFAADAQQLGAAHAIALDRALRAACLDPALVAGENDLGRLLPGYLADLLVVPAAGLREPVDGRALAETRPRAVMIGGEVVHRDDRFEHRA